MIDINDVAFSKERILDTIKNKGPTLPVNISKVLNCSMIFASAFLSELIEDGKIKISNLRVGSSPLYFMAGQEDQLENFTQYLNQKEKEAFQILKDRRVLIDEKIEPAVRVALRAIKDFAVPMTLTMDGKSQLIWKYFSVSDEEVEKIIKKIYNIKEEKELEKEKTEEKITEQKTKIEKKKKSEKIEEKQKEEVEEKIPQKETKKAKKTIPTNNQFSSEIQEYLSAKDVEFLEIFLEKKKEIEGKIRIDTLFGKQEFYLIAKDKKSITDNDISAAHQKAQGVKLPALLVSKGELNKKAKEYLKPLNNLIKFEKLDLE